MPAAYPEIDEMQARAVVEAGKQMADFNLASPCSAQRFRLGRSHWEVLTVLSDLNSAGLCTRHFVFCRYRAVDAFQCQTGYHASRLWSWT